MKVLSARYTGRRPGRRLGASTLEPSQRLLAALAILAVVLAGGTIGYVVLGTSPIEGLYQTVITISTVGYNDLVDIDYRHRIFTICLILLGTGTALYTIGVTFELLFEGRLDDQLRRRRMQKAIDNLSGHVVLCGYGQVGRAIAASLAEGGLDIVVVDQVERHELELDDLTPHLEGLLFVTGDITDDRNLAQAGVERARVLVLATDSDVDNLYVTLTARTLSADLFIVSRANHPTAVDKLHRAGANRVVNPSQIGGDRMAQVAMAPDAHAAT